MEKRNQHEKVERSLFQLEKWLMKNGVHGWDPYDLKGLKFYRFFLSRNSFFFKVLQVLLYYVCDVFLPIFFRKIYSVEKKINPKGIGLLLKGNILRHKATGEQRYLTRSIEHVNWLIENQSKDCKGASWGYPFDWQSKTFIPKHTPSSVVSCIIGDSVWLLYEVTKEKKYLDVCIQICEFLFDELNITHEDEDSCCHSYTPIDDFQVHNANLFVAEFLLRVGLEIDKEEWKTRGVKAANYALKFQLADGSIEYWSQDHPAYKKGQMDVYHSGYEIRALQKIWYHTKDARFKKAFEKYYEFFNRAYFTDKGHVKLKPTNQYPVDIHGVAETIILFLELTDEDHSALSRAEGILHWTIDKMQAKQGWFHYRIVRLPFGMRKNIRIPYLRWAQGWMFIALAGFLNAKENDNGKGI